MHKKIVTISLICILIIQFLGCTNRNKFEPEISLKNNIYASWSSNLNFELGNFSKSLIIISGYHKQTPTVTDILQQKAAIKMFVELNQLYILNQILQNSNIPENIISRLILPQYQAKLYCFNKTFDLMKVINKRLTEILCDDYLDKKELEKYNKYNYYLKELANLYSSLGTDFRTEKYIKVNLETIEKINNINDKLISVI